MPEINIDRNLSNNILKKCLKIEKEFIYWNREQKFEELNTIK